MTVTLKKGDILTRLLVNNDKVITKSKYEVVESSPFLGHLTLSLKLIDSDHPCFIMGNRIGTTSSIPVNTFDEYGIEIRHQDNSDIFILGEKLASICRAKAKIVAHHNKILRGRLHKPIYF